LRCACVVSAREVAFERFVLRGDLRVSTQMIPKHQVLQLLLSSAFAQMNVMRAGPLDWLVKEGIHEIKIAERYVTIPKCSHRSHVATVRRQRSN